MKVAFVGLGSMGGPLARLIAAAGHELAVFDPFAPALDKFAGIARQATSPADAARGAEVAGICVRDDADVETVLFGPEGLAEALEAGALVLVHSTIRIASVHAFAARLAERGIRLVDAPVSRTRQGVEDAPFVVTMLGGEEADVAAAAQIAAAYSTEVQPVGPRGAGMATKIANNLITWVQIVVGAQAFGMAARNGVPFERLQAITMANGNLTPTMRAMLGGRAAAGSNPSPEAAAFWASQAGIGEKDLALAAECLEGSGVEAKLATTTGMLVRGVMTKPAIG